jgi:hypothetical protein
MLIQSSIRSSAVIGEALARALESGDFGPLAELYTDDALFDASLPARRVRLTGRAAIRTQLEQWWSTPGRLRRFDVTSFPSGLTVEFERSWRDDGERLWRQRHFLQTREGQIARHQIYCARPQSPAAAAASPLVERAIAKLEGEVVGRESLTHAGQSGNTLERVLLADGSRLVVKGVRAEGDWISRATRDRCREAMLWGAGVFSRLPREIDPAILVCEQEDDESVIVMRDVSEVLLPPDRILSRAESQRILDAAGKMYRAFVGEVVDGLCSLADRLTLMAPATLAKEFEECDYLPKMMTVGWEVFAEEASADVVEAIFEVHAHPQPLAVALERSGTTLAHGDLRGANLGLVAQGLVLLDWGLATRSPAAVDFAWYLFVNGWRIAATHEQLIDDFRAALGTLFDERSLDLGLVAGLAFHGGLLAHELIESSEEKRVRARRELDWWSDRVRSALERWPL